MPAARKSPKAAKASGSARGAGHPRAEPLFVEAGPANWEATVTAFIRRHVESAGAKGIVLGMSGGLDSAVVGALGARALGRSKVLAVAMPAADSDPKDLRHAELACKAIGVRLVVRPIGAIADAVAEALGGKVGAAVLGNAKSRARMVTLYAIAQA